MSWLLRSRRGGFKIGQAVWIVVILGLGYPVYQLAGPEWRYLRMRHKISGSVNELKVNTPESIRKSIMSMAKEVGLPDEFENKLKIYKDTSGNDGGQFVAVESEYTDVTKVFGRFKVERHRVFKTRKALWK